MKVVAPLLTIAQNLRNAAAKVMNSSEETLETSQNLSKGTHDQASSLQETVSSIDEISAMIDRNTDSARKSKETSYQSQEAAKRGKKTIDEMLESINAITENNTNTVKRIEHNNKQVQDILDIIKEIEITPEEVRQFFYKIPEDERPVFGAELEIAQIVKQPEAPEEEKQKVIDQLKEIRQDVLENDASFNVKAILYSQDPGSKSKGGLYAGLTKKTQFVKEFKDVAFNKLTTTLSNSKSLEKEFLKLLLKRSTKGIV